MTGGVGKCDTGKEMFSSAKQARIFAKSRMHGVRVRAYLCPDCYHWHITRSYVERNAK